MPDLFAAARQTIHLPGPVAGCELHYYPQFLDPPAASHLLRLLTGRVQWRQSHIRIAGRKMPIPRLNAWYGEASANYGYSGIRLPTNPWFDELEELRQKINAETRGQFNSALLNLYRNGGDSVAWHSDDEPELGASPLIASISLGATRKFQLRRKQGGERLSLNLRHGALLVMAGDTQRHWQHRIPKEQKVTKPRINITFRRVVNQPGR